MWLDGPFDNYHVVGTTIRNVWADGINFHRGVTNSVVEQSIFRGTGDDSLALWPDSAGESKNVFKQNSVFVPLFANGIAIYGGSDHQVLNNDVYDTVCEGSGIQVGNRFNSQALGGTITITGNTLTRCGTKNRANDAHSGSYWFWADQQAITAAIVVSGGSIIDSTWPGVTFWGSTINNITFSNITIKGATYAVEVGNLAGTPINLNGNAYFTTTVASGLSDGGIYQCQNSTNTPFKINLGAGCSGWSDVHGCPPPPPMVCNKAIKTDCGYFGITEQDCETKNCCWDPVDPNPGNIPWCYNKTPNGTSVFNFFN